MRWIRTVWQSVRQTKGCKGKYAHSDTIGIYTKTEGRFCWLGFLLKAHDFEKDDTNFHIDFLTVRCLFDLAKISKIIPCQYTHVHWRPPPTCVPATTTSSTRKGQQCANTANLLVAVAHFWNAADEVKVTAGRIIPALVPTSSTCEWAAQTPGFGEPFSKLQQTTGALLSINEVPSMPTLKHEATKYQVLQIDSRP